MLVVGVGSSTPSFIWYGIGIGFASEGVLKWSIYPFRISQSYYIILRVVEVCKGFKLHRHRLQLENILNQVLVSDGSPRC